MSWARLRMARGIAERRAQRRLERRRAAPDTTKVVAASPAPKSKIDISAAPSGMEAQAERWKGEGVSPMELAPVPVLCAGEVLCRCGSRASGKGRGPVPVWFGDKCIENNCELRAAGGRAR